MLEPRNPFRMQNSEQITSDIWFLRLFEPSMLELLPSPDRLWNRISVIRSSPGGGKTTLMRLFTPELLLKLYQHANSEEYKDLFLRMIQLEVMTQEGPNVLGILLSCSKSDYTTIEDINIPTQNKRKLLFSIFDARVVIGALRCALGLKNLNFPEDLNRLSVNIPPEVDIPIKIQRKATGDEWYKWACDVENSVYELVNSFGPIEQEHLIPHDEFFSPFILNQEYIRIDDKKVCDHTLIMLDDCHKLTRSQRDYLYEIVDKRPPVPVWIAERKEALYKEEILVGALLGRDVNTIELEDYWHNGKKFEKIALKIADKRANFNSDISSFSACLKDSFIDYQEYQQLLKEAAKQIEKRVSDKGKVVERYTDWLEYKSEVVVPSIEQEAISWKSLEILIERDLGKSQKVLFDFPPYDEISYDVTELQKREDSAVRSAAELFLSRELKIPYYYGPSKIASIASSNVEQFLWFSGDIFEEILSEHLIKPGTQISPKRQEELIKKAVLKRWNEIPSLVRNGNEVRQFLEEIAKMAKWETYRPNAPYAPGVSGIGILMTDRLKLIHEPKQYGQLATIISDCIAHNLLETRFDAKCKGNSWMILYLNRMLCVLFDLPLQYGGWRDKKLNELTKWCNGQPTNKGGKLIVE